MAKKVLVAFPAAMLAQIDYVTQAEHRTRSDLIREAMRFYMTKFKRDNNIPLEAQFDFEQRRNGPPAAAPAKVPAHYYSD
jgi:hypothetical protein